MDGRGRVYVNIFIERLWWSVKHKKCYLRGSDSVTESRLWLGRYFGVYNHDRPHQFIG